MVKYNEYTISIDDYQGLPGHLRVAEIEFNSIEEATGFKGPDWLVGDITGNLAHSNAQLAREGLPNPY